MKLHIPVLALSLLTVCSVNAAQELTITLNKEQLEKNLEGMFLEHFLEKTHLVDKLSQNELALQGVMMALETSLYKYSEYMKGSPAAMAAHLTSLRKNDIIEAILKDNPEAFEYLKTKGFLR